MDIFGGRRFVGAVKSDPKSGGDKAQPSGARVNLV
jgi:hypothetical protein